jgi:ketosteroid isomerase-like protein
MRLTLLALFWYAAVAAGCATTAPATHPPAEIRSALADLAAAYNACNIDKALSFYDRDVYFVSSNTPSPITSVQGVKRYFEAGCRMTPNPTVAIRAQEVRIAGDFAVSTGSYVFTMMQGGKPAEVPNNFTLTFRRDTEGWKILSHHSSLLPPAPVAR